MVQAQVLMRASDPLYEIGMALGGHRQEDKHWAHTLGALASPLGAGRPEVATQTVCVDRKRQWREPPTSGRTPGYAPGCRRSPPRISARRPRPARFAARRLGLAARTRSSSAAGPTASRPRSSWRGSGLGAVIERAAEIGGGRRTAELTLPGFRHDVCSAVHPLAVGLAVPPTLPLEPPGLRLAAPEMARASAR